MRIGIVTVSYLPRLGGAVTQTILLHRYLSQKGHHVEVFCPDLERSGQFQEDGITVNRVRHSLAKNFYTNFARFFIMWALRSAVQRHRRDFDAFITPEFNIGPLSLCLTFGTKKVGIYGADLTFESVNISRSQIIPYAQVLEPSPSATGWVNFLLIKLLYGLQTFMCRRLDHVIALNPADTRRLRRRTPHVSQIPCLIAPSAISPALATKPKREPEIATIIGRAVSWKKIDESIQVALEIKKSFPHLQIHYFGTGPEMPRIQAGYSRDITIHTDLKNTQILEWLTKSDLTINMSEYETFCIANVEAMFSRSLLLVKPLPEYSDYLEDRRNCFAMSFPPAPKEIQQVVDAFKSGGIKAQLDAAQQTVVEKMDIRRTSDQIEALLAAVAQA
jgi:glycosyltransferase involved in cell wall biosynthesis